MEEEQGRKTKTEEGNEKARGSSHTVSASPFASFLCVSFPFPVS